MQQLYYNIYNMRFKMKFEDTYRPKGLTHTPGPKQQSPVI